MGVAEKYNGNKSKFKYVQTDEPVYFKLQELAVMDEADGKVSKQIYKVLGLYINDSPYGPAPVAVCEGFNVNLPMYLTETIQQMLQDDEVIEQINAGCLGFRIKPYHKHGRQCYGLKWVDIEVRRY